MKLKREKTAVAPSQSAEKQRVGAELSFAVSEAYKLLRANIMFSFPEDEETCRVIGVTSSLPSEGKSTTAMNLAYSIAETGKRVLVIEGDMRLPVMSKRLDIPESVGLSNLLAGLCNGNDVIHRSTLISGLDVITGGDIPPNPSELLGSHRMAKVVDALKKGYDYIVIDLPPVSSVSDALVVSSLLDGVILVVRRDRCDQQVLSETVRQLKFHNAKILGFVFTCSEVLKKKYKKYKRHKSGYGYYNYGYDSRGYKRSQKQSSDEIKSE